MLPTAAISSAKHTHDLEHERSPPQKNPTTQEVAERCLCNLSKTDRTSSTTCPVDRFRKVLAFAQSLIQEEGNSFSNMLYGFDCIATPKRLIEVFKHLVQQNKDTVFHTQLTQTLLNWIQARPFDFTGEEMVASALSFKNDTMPAAAVQKLQLLLLSCKERTTTTLFAKEDTTIGIREANKEIKRCWRSWIENTSSLCDSLTSAASKLYLSIEPRHLTPSLDVTPSNPVKFFADRFNQLSYWVISVILVAESQDEQQSIAQKMLSLANKLHKKSNFQDCAAVVEILSNVVFPKKIAP